MPPLHDEDSTVAAHPSSAKTQKTFRRQTGESNLPAYEFRSQPSRSSSSGQSEASTKISIDKVEARQGSYESDQDRCMGHFSLEIPRFRETIERNQDDSLDDALDNDITEATSLVLNVSEKLEENDAHRLDWKISVDHGWSSLRSICLRVILPLAGLSWWWSGSVLFAMIGILAIPVLAIVQGSFAIYRYRANFGDCPVPKAPSQGLVRVVGKSRLEKFNDDSKTDIPIRLLVIGDSLAIGVGQASCSTPVMPEAIAKVLSKEFDGRSVQWTCHGAPGASAGWIVRELERSIRHGSFQKASKDETLENHNGSAQDSAVTREKNANDEQSFFDSKMIGEFDLAIVLTGSNDLKSAFFPFLLQGDDVKFREEAQQLGGGYEKQLTRIMKVLNKQMRKQLNMVRDSIEEATHTVRRRLGSIGLQERSYEQADDDRVSFDPECGSFVDVSVDAKASSDDSRFPMVVLPGMPSRALPIFSISPLRWLAVPVVDIMDTHKKELSAQSDGQVLFVQAPTSDQIVEYLDERGDYWKDECDDCTVLQLRDINKHDARQLELELNAYYSLDRNKKSLTKEQNRHFNAFSVDGIHPNEAGYLFWGRHIANQIVKEWRDRKNVGKP